MIPYDSGDYREELQYKFGDITGNLATSCGCLSSDVTGKPTDLVAMQYYGLVYLSWTDQSYCESGFAITRDGEGFTSDYYYVAPETCGEVHEPKTVYDDLLAQNTDPGMYESDINEVYAWPDASYVYTILGNAGGRWPDAPIQLATVTSAAECLEIAIQYDRADHDTYFRVYNDGTMACAVNAGGSVSRQNDGSEIHGLARFSWTSGVGGEFFPNKPMSYCRALCTELDYSECAGVLEDEWGCAYVDELLATSGGVAARSPDTVAERRMPFYPVGSTQTYCISAINPVGYGTDGYVSDQVWRMGGGGGGRGRRKAGPWRRHVSQQHSPRCRLRTVRPTRRAHPLTSTGRASSPAAWFSTAPQATCRWWAFTSTTRSARASKR